MSSKTSNVLIVVLGIGLVALAIYSLVTISGLNTDVGDLEDQTASLEESSSGDKKSSLKEVAKRLRKIEECLPELQTELNSMEIENLGEELWVSVGSQVSSYCSDVVYPPVQGQGE